jgi:hypothetical protein
MAQLAATRRSPSPIGGRLASSGDRDPPRERAVGSRPEDTCRGQVKRQRVVVRGQVIATSSNASPHG